ncbi:hypothetical protein GW17_00024122 [Ensete ventricosum]|nr:hypothetical protein GW17_00024122 [Ensete ventricosum]
MKLCHDFDSIVTVECLIAIQERYSILDEYALHAPYRRDRPTRKRVKVLSSRQKSHHGEGGSKSRSSKGKEPAEPTREAAATTIQRPKSIRELCHTPIVDKDEGYHPLRMTNLSLSDPDAPMTTHWPTMDGLCKEIKELKVGSGPVAIVATKQRVVDFQAEVDLEEATRQREASKELNESRFLFDDT